MAAKSNIALAALTFVACSLPAPRPHGQPLVDDLHLPEVLTESRVIELPPSLEGNRFLRGWFPWQHEGARVLVPDADGAWLEVVNISGRSRVLKVDLRILGEPASIPVGVRVAGRSLASVPLASSLEVRLPADLPLGRVPVSLQFPKTPDPVVLEAAVDTALPPGDVEITPKAILQAPASLIDFTRLVAAGTRLSGRFEPPTDPKPGQRFGILLEREGQPAVTLFEWRDRWWDRVRGGRSFSLPLGDGQGPVRLRLLAAGSGSPGRWRDLMLEFPPPTPAAPATTPPAPPRLVMLYVLDALRADHVELSEDRSTPTPTLRRLASEGVVFHRHRSVAPNTIPSTKSLFTGQAFVTRGHWKLAADGPETLAEIFARAGYRTAAFSGNGYISAAYGTSRGFQHLADEVVFQEYEDRQGAYNDNAERVHRSALQWLASLADDERAFLYLHTIHPHNPYDPPEPFRSALASGITSSFEASTDNLLHIKHNRMEVSEADQQRIAALYAGALAYNDAQLQLLLEELERRFSSQQILLMVTSDHGEELFDHGGVLHGYTLYREQLEIPLLLWWPGTLQPHQVEAATDNLDLHESLRALAGASPSEAAEGSPFWDLATGKERQGSTPELHFAAASSVKGGIFSVQSERYKLILAPRAGMAWGMGEGRGRSRDPEYLFDLTVDPEEQVNRAGESSLEVAWLRSRLLAWIERGKYLEMDEEQPQLDEETRRRLRALGYLE